MRIMKSAALCGMPKLLACCEHWVVLDALKSSQNVALRGPCLKEEQLSQSWSHIAEGSVMAFHNVCNSGFQARFDRSPCNCECCQKHPGGKGGVSCKCTMAVKNDKAVTFSVPSPKEFLKMAAADNSA